MNVLIVDDEKKAREIIKQLILLEGFQHINIREANGVETALQSINQSPPDLLLLDIQLKDGSGFDLLNKIKDHDFQLIFITAFDEYAIKACKVSALDYLLKPIDPDEFNQAIKKAEKKISREKLADRLDTFLQNMEGNARELKKITLKTVDTIYIVNISDIVFCEGAGNYTTFHLLDQQKIMVSKPIGEYEEMISTQKFIRVHQSFLVNVDHIIRYKKGEGGFIITVLNNSIPVSTRKKEQLMNFLNRI
jgi:two-component system LytT family response regulator